MKLWNTTSLVIMIIVFFVIIAIHFIIGMKNVRYLEKVCTENINANYEIVKKYKFFTKNYYSVLLKFEYNNKTYEIRKGLFKNTKDKEQIINIHINPNNPNECYLLSIKERCGMC